MVSHGTEAAQGEICVYGARRREGALAIGAHVPIDHASMLMSADRNAAIDVGSIWLERALAGK